MKRFMTAAALFALGLVFGAMGVGYAATPTFLPQSADQSALPGQVTLAPPVDDSPLFVQYGDPDDAITGNRGPGKLGGQAGVGENDPLPLPWKTLETIRRLMLGLVPVAPTR